MSDFEGTNLDLIDEERIDEISDELCELLSEGTFSTEVFDERLSFYRPYTDALANTLTNSENIEAARQVAFDAFAFACSIGVLVLKNAGTDVDSFLAEVQEVPQNDRVQHVRATAFDSRLRFIWCDRITNNFMLEIDPLGVDPELARTVAALTFKHMQDYQERVEHDQLAIDIKFMSMMIDDWNANGIS